MQEKQHEENRQHGLKAISLGVTCGAGLATAAPATAVAVVSVLSMHNPYNSAKSEPEIKKC